MRARIIAAAALLAYSVGAPAQTQESPELYVQVGHGQGVNAAAFTRDGRFVVSGGRDATVRLWQADTGREVRAYVGHSATVMSLALFPDGKRIVSGSVDRTVRVWDLETGRELQVMSGHEDWVNRVAVSPDGGRVASVSGDFSLRIWDPNSGKEVRRIANAHDDFVSALAWSPDGRLIASGNMRSSPQSRTTIAIWEAASGRELNRISISHARVPAQFGTPRVAFSPDSRMLLAAWSGPERLARVYEVGSGTQVAQLAGHGDGVAGVAFSPDGRLAATSSFDGTAKVWSTAGWREVGTLAGHQAWVNDVAFSPDSKRIVTSGQDNRLKIWDAGTQKEERTLQGIAVSKLSIALAGRQIAVGGPRNFLQVWNADTGKLQTTFPGRLPPVRAFNAPRRGMATGFGERGIPMQQNMLDALRQAQYSPDGTRYQLRALAAAPGGSVIAAAAPDHSIRLMEPKSGKEIRRIAAHKDYVSALDYSPDGRLLASASRDRSVAIWDAATGAKRHEFETRETEVQAIAFSPEGRRLAAGALDGKVRIWDLASARLVDTLELSRGAMVLSLAWSPDGKIIATGDTQRRVVLWDADRGRELRTLEGHANWVTAVAFSPDSRTVYSGSWDGTARIWDAASGRASHILSGHFSTVSGLAAEEKRLYTAGQDGSVRVWDARTGALVLTMASFSDGEWVATTPEGYFNSSENGAKWLTIRFGNRAYGLDQYQEAFFRPDLVTVTLSGGAVPVSTAPAPPAPAAPAAPAVAAAPPAPGAPAAAPPVPAPAATPAAPPAPSTPPVAPAVPAPAAAPAVTATAPPTVPPASAAPAVAAAPAAPPSSPAPAAALAPATASAAAVPPSPLRIPGSQRIEQVKPAPAVAFVDAPASASAEQITVRLRVADAGGGVGDVRLYLNGAAVLVERTRTLQVAAAGNVLNYPLRLVNGKNAIRAVAFNADNTMQSTAAEFEIDARISRARRPSLHAVVIGIQEFENPRLALRYSVADAELFASTLAANAQGLFESVNVTKLVARTDTTKEKVLAALEVVRQNAGPEDLFAFFVASHGTVDEGEYFLITSNVGSTTSARLKRDAISQSELKVLLANVPSTKKLIILDTCHAGKLGEALQVAMLTRGMSEETALKILSRAMGTTILSASTSLQEAIEGYNGHGLFTYVISEGLKGKADVDRDGFVKTTELADYVDNEVPELAEKVFKHKQYPVISPSGQGFPVARVR